MRPHDAVPRDTARAPQLHDRGPLGQLKPEIGYGPALLPAAPHFRIEGFQVHEELTQVVLAVAVHARQHAPGVEPLHRRSHGLKLLLGHRLAACPAAEGVEEGVRSSIVACAQSLSGHRLGQKKRGHSTDDYRFGFASACFLACLPDRTIRPTVVK